MIEPFFKKFITTFIIDVSHLSGEIFSTIEILTQNLSFSHRNKYFDGIAYLEFSTAKMISYWNLYPDRVWKKTPIEIWNSIENL